MSWHDHAQLPVDHVILRGNHITSIFLQEVAILVNGFSHVTILSQYLIILSCYITTPTSCAYDVGGGGPCDGPSQCLG